ncbi:MAG: hypothetical protein ACRYHA_30850 [Janthinobacterium lividum]
MFVDITMPIKLVPGAAINRPNHGNTGASISADYDCRSFNTAQGKIQTNNSVKLALQSRNNGSLPPNVAG